MERSEVVQHLLNLHESSSYLEVGVNRGVTFRAVEAERKVAVDPEFLFDVPESNGHEAYYEVVSDEYFGNMSLRETFNVVYLDGLHTFEQTLRDFTNAIEVIRDKGCILIDDIKPNSYHASLPSQHMAVKLRNGLGFGAKDKSWMGDTYRLLFFIQTFFQQYSYATVADNHGQLVVWKKLRPAADIVERKVESLGRYPFEKIVLEESAFNIMPMSEIIELIKKDQT